MSKLSIRSANSFYMYDKDNHLFEGMNDDWTPLSDISPYLINATIAIEDKHFYKHLNTKGLMRFYPQLLHTLSSMLQTRIRF